MQCNNPGVTKEYERLVAETAAKFARSDIPKCVVEVSDDQPRVPTDASPSEEVSK